MKIERKIYKMLVENTGTHPMDSGGGQNRHWQRNGKKSFQDFKKEDPVSFTINKYGTDISISVFHFLRSVLDEYRAADTKSLQRFWEKRDWSIWDWAEWSGWEQVNPQIHNTYNGDCLLTQTLQFQTGTLTSGESGIILQIHGGADVRGGYTDPAVFTLAEYDSIWNYNDGSVNCNECPAEWTTEGGYYYRSTMSGVDDLQDMKIVELDDLGMRFSHTRTDELFALADGTTTKVYCPVCKSGILEGHR